MKERLIKNVKLVMSKVLDEKQLEELEFTLLRELENYSLDEMKHELVEYDDTSDRLLRRFLAERELAGLQKSTLEGYRYENERMMQDIGKDVKSITSDDLKWYFAKIMHEGKAKSYINNRIVKVNAFFRWLAEEDYITGNPMIKIHHVKEDKVVRPAYTDAEREELKLSASNLRDLAIMEVLYSTGARVSELCRMNRSDIKGNECVVFGKGNKERTVYFNETSMYYLKKYLATRTDDDDALFVRRQKPYTRITIKAIQTMLSRLSAKCGIEDVHAHKFRRTLATNCLNRGASIVEVKTMLGHERIDTTLIYCQVEQQNVKLAHQRCA